MFGTRKLGKTSAQRKALLRQQVTDLLEYGKLETTWRTSCSRKLPPAMPSATAATPALPGPAPVAATRPRWLSSSWFNPIRKCSLRNRREHFLNCGHEELDRQKAQGLPPARWTMD